MANLYHPEVEKLEHDDASQAKRVMLYGWDANTLTPVKLNVDQSGAMRVESWELMDVEEAAPITYIGKEKEDGSWIVQKIDTTSDTVSRWAGVSNNPTLTGYTQAWTDRASLTYGLRSEAT
jgi:hypothetical protein